MTAADKLRELLATRPALPSLEELTRWWRASVDLLPQLLAERASLIDARHELSRARLAFDKVAAVVGADIAPGAPSYETLAETVELMRVELAGVEGELAGQRVTAQFFQRRCEVLEAAAVRELNGKEQNIMLGCCPLCAARRYVA